jgi:hypothetical protein
MEAEKLLVSSSPSYVVVCANEAVLSVWFFARFANKTSCSFSPTATTETAP